MIPDEANAGRGQRGMAHTGREGKSRRFFEATRLPAASPAPTLHPQKERQDARPRHPHHEGPGDAGPVQLRVTAGGNRRPCLIHDVMRYRLVVVMIENFKCKETEKIFARQFSQKLPTDIQQVAFRKLRMLNRSSSIGDLRIPPANRLEMLSGNRKGQHSIRINQQWRICFRWKDGNAYNVEIVDYH